MWNWKAFWIGFILVLLLGYFARVHAECLPSAQAVRDLHRSHPYWSEQIRGHKGEKCWFAEGWRNREVAAVEKIPMPRARTYAAVAEVPPAEPDWCRCARDFDFSFQPEVSDDVLRERYLTVAFAAFLQSSRSNAARVQVRPPVRN